MTRLVRPAIILRVPLATIRRVLFAAIDETAARNRLLVSALRMCGAPALAGSWGRVVLSAEECRERAFACLEQAEKTKDCQIRTCLIDLAAAWLRLAHRVAEAGIVDQDQER